MEINTVAFGNLNCLSEGSIHEIPYEESELEEWCDGNISQLTQSNAPSFIKDFISLKKQPGKVRCKSSWYFGEASLSIKLAENTKEGWFNSFKWLYSDTWLTGNVSGKYQKRFYKEAIDKYIRKSILHEMHDRWKQIDDFPNEPKTPDLWLIDHNENYHFIEVKTWKWDYDKNSWKTDKPKDSQIAGLALLKKYLPCKVYIALLYPSNRKPDINWDNYIDQFNHFEKLLDD